MIQVAACADDGKFSAAMTTQMLKRLVEVVRVIAFLSTDVGSSVHRPSARSYRASTSFDASPCAASRSAWLYLTVTVASCAKRPESPSTENDVDPATAPAGIGGRFSV